MSLSGLLGPLTADPAVGAAVTAARSRPTVAFDLTGPAALRPFLVGALAEHCPLLVVTATGREAEDLAAGIRSVLPAGVPGDAVVDFPNWETLPHERLSPSSDVVGRRLAVLRRLRHPGAVTASGSGPVRVVVAPVRSVLQPLVTGLADLEPTSAKPGEELPMEDLVAGLAGAGYARSDLVEKRGQFAVRGGIVDVFPPTQEHPLRVEFWGDTVEEVRWFRVSDQRSLEAAPDGLWAPPCRELLLTDRVRERAAALIGQSGVLDEMLGKLAEGIYVEGMEALSPVLADGMETLLDVLPGDTMVLCCDPERIRTRARDLVATSNEFLEAAWHNATVGNEMPIDLGSAAYRSMEEIREVADSRGIAWSSISPFALDEEIADPGARILISSITASPAYRGELDAALTDIAAARALGRAVVLVTAGHGPAQRIVESLAAQDVPARLVEDLETPPSADVVTVTCAAIELGLLVGDDGPVVLTETDLFGQRGATRDMQRMPARRRQTIDPLQLQPGDHVVHEQHGVGRYVEMVQRTVAGATREYLVLEYAASKRGQPGDRLFVPTDQLDQVTRYVGGEAPSLHRLGGADWQKAKGRARKAVREIAGELVRLYAARMASQGYAFGPDTPWQRELEDAFPYHETPDQQSSIDEVKADMEKAIPMDRLICGDVGYGKTEIAVRAAFKAVQDGKQVAVLVPTTLLVQQHTATFTGRFAQFPVKVASLSRFQSEKEAKVVLEGLAEGTIDVVIGTHRLFGAQTRFKDLGLLIVDEEQRFGVEHKEHIKALRTNVDVLSMSATPIPRTLEMAVTGIREMSTIATAPEDRHPVLTYVGPYDDKQIGASIRRELLREGQVFFLHNRVESIERVAARIRDLVPEARVAVAHGQMSEGLLEKVIVDFWEKQADVLVCTTIVESGLDIPNANTLIVDRADKFGLSQLHQLRGRVGRGRERAYAYFLYPPEQPLTETAHDRLATIAQYTDLGSGMAVAMKDLEIRGAGNLLGGEQSGHIADVGFDLYIRLVGEALAEHKGEAAQENVEVRVELPVDAHLPHAYVPEQRLRLEAYRRMAAAQEGHEVDAVADELRDRYGQLPAPVETLLEVARVRVLARRAGLREVVLAGNSVRFAPVELPESRMLRLTRLYPGTLVKPATRTILVPRPTTAKVGGQPLRDRELLAWAHDLIGTVLLDPASSTTATTSSASVKEPR